MKMLLDGKNPAEQSCYKSLRFGLATVVEVENLDEKPIFFFKISVVKFCIFGIGSQYLATAHHQIHSNSSKRRLKYVKEEKIAILLVLKRCWMHFTQFPDGIETRKF